MSPYGWYVRFPGDLLLLTSTRDLIDSGVRGRVAALPNVQIHQGADVAGLIRGRSDGDGVAGVRLRARSAGLEADRCGEELTADLVVVADGRNSRLPDWLTAWATSRRKRPWLTPPRAMPRASTGRPQVSRPTGRPCTSSRPPRPARAGASSRRSRGGAGSSHWSGRRRLPAHRRGWLLRLRPQPAEPGNLRGDRGGRAPDADRRPTRDRKPAAALRPPRALP